MSAPQRPAVLVTEPIHQGGVRALEELATIIRPERPGEAASLAAVIDAFPTCASSGNKAW